MCDSFISLVTIKKRIDACDRLRLFDVKSDSASYEETAFYLSNRTLSNLEKTQSNVLNKDINLKSFYHAEFLQGAGRNPDVYVSSKTSLKFNCLIKVEVRSTNRLILSHDLK